MEAIPLGSCSGKKKGSEPELNHFENSLLQQAKYIRSPSRKTLVSRTLESPSTKPYKIGINPHYAAKSPKCTIKIGSSGKSVLGLVNPQNSEILQQNPAAAFEHVQVLFEDILDLIPSDAQPGTSSIVIALVRAGKNARTPWCAAAVLQCATRSDGQVRMTRTQLVAPRRPAR